MVNSFLKFFLIFIFICSSISFAADAHKAKDADTLSVQFSVAGDLMCHSPQFEYAGTDSGYDFTSNYMYVKKFIDSADVAIGNFETVLAGDKKKYSGYPRFNTPDEYLSAVKGAGFDILTTSNNHALDKGKKGVLRTIEKIKDAGLINVGTYASQRERDSLRVFNVNGISFTLLSYSYGTNGMPVPKGDDYLINLIGEDLIKADIEKAKQADVDLIIVYFHFGNEYQTQPSAFQKDIVQKTIGYGADIILGGHPHVVEPVERYKTNDAHLDSGFVVYSMGNFISNQRWRYSDGGPILKFTINKIVKTDSIFVKQIRLIPTWVFKGPIDSVDTYTIIPSDSTSLEYRYSFLSEQDEKDMQQSYRDIMEIMSSRYKKIKFYSPSAGLKNIELPPCMLKLKPKPIPPLEVIKIN